MKKIFIALTVLLSSMQLIAQSQYAIIPKPTLLTPAQGEFVVNASTKIIIPNNNAAMADIAQLFAQRMMITANLNLDINADAKPASNYIKFEIPAQKLALKEGYKMTVNNNSIVISADEPIGHFYALQTLLQLLPPQVFSSSPMLNTKWAVPACSITDSPRYAYRGLMLDVGRHTFPVTFIKKYIDLLALHKMNTFHWHLTEDQGWRIEIKKYPKLTQIGSVRRESVKGHNRDQMSDGTPYGGFYTQDEIKEVVRYAQSKYITVVPEIEMPGHAMAALAAYPELGCSGGPYEVATRWGVMNDVFCPNEKTFEFLQDVLTEVMDLFPSKYIHIGGDECPKVSWKKSQFCQDLMKKEGLKDEHELQSYFIKRIDKFVTSKGRKIIGWDEILEGGISPNATIMSWRGVDGGIAAAKQGHDAIMTPTTYNYFDYYQADPSNEPLAIGGYLPLEKTYSYEPMPKELTPEQAKHIMGVQGNLWTEYVTTPEYAEYMTYPRASALAEVAWTPSKQKDYTDFGNRLKTHFERLRYLGVNYAKSFYDITAYAERDANGRVVAKLNSNDKQALIKYSLDGSDPKPQSMSYAASGIVLTQNTYLNATAFGNKGEALSKPVGKFFFVNKATGRSYTLKNEPKNYTGGSSNGLTNGLKGEEKSLSTWLGFEGKDLDAVVDLGQKTDFSRVSVAFFRSSSQWIMLPSSIEILISDDGKQFKSIKKIDLDNSDKAGQAIQQLAIGLDNANARYVKVVAPNYGLLPENHPGHGKSAWLFVDEIGVE